MSTMVMPSDNHKPFHSESDPFGIYNAYSQRELTTVDYYYYYYYYLLQFGCYPVAVVTLRVKKQEIGYY